MTLTDEQERLAVGVLRALVEELGFTPGSSDGEGSFVADYELRLVPTPAAQDEPDEAPLALQAAPLSQALLLVLLTPGELAAKPLLAMTRDGQQRAVTPALEALLPALRAAVWGPQRKEDVN
jgi:hypothetical protein